MLAVIYAMPRVDDQVTLRELSEVASGYPLHLRPIALRQQMKRLGGFVWQNNGGIRRVQRLAAGDEHKTVRVAVPRNLPAWTLDCAPAQQVVDELFASVYAQVMGERIPGNEPVIRPERRKVVIDEASRTRHLDHLDELRAAKRRLLGLRPESRETTMARRYDTDWRARTSMSTLQKLISAAVKSSDETPSNRGVLQKKFMAWAKTGEPLSPDVTLNEAADVALGAHVMLSAALHFKSTAHSDLDVTAVRAVGRWLERVVDGTAPYLDDHEAEVVNIRMLADGNPRQLLVDIAYVMSTVYLQANWARAFNFFTVGFDSRVATEAIPALLRLHAKRPLKSTDESPATLQEVTDRLAVASRIKLPPHPTHLRWNTTPEERARREKLRVQGEAQRTRWEMTIAETQAANAALEALATAEAARPVQGRIDELLTRREGYFADDAMPARMARATKPAQDSSGELEEPNWRFFLVPHRVEFGDYNDKWQKKLSDFMKEYRAGDDKLHELGYDLTGMPSLGERIQQLFSADADSQDYVFWILVEGGRGSGAPLVDPRAEWATNFDHPAIRNVATQVAR